MATVTAAEVDSLLWAFAPKASPSTLAMFVVASFDRNSYAVASRLDQTDYPTPEMENLVAELRRAAVAVAYPKLQPDVFQLEALLEDSGKVLTDALHRVTVSICKHWRYVPGCPLSKILFWCRPHQVEVVRALLTTNLECCGAVRGSWGSSPKIDRAVQAARNWSSRSSLETLLRQTKPPFYPPKFRSWGDVALEVVYVVERALEANRVFTTQHYPCAWWDDRFEEYRCLHSQIVAAVERAVRSEPPQLGFEQWFLDHHHDHHAYTKTFVLSVAQAMLVPTPSVTTLNFPLAEFWPWLYKTVLHFDVHYPGARIPV